MNQVPLLVSGRNGRMARLFAEAACADPEVDLLGRLAPEAGEETREETGAEQAGQRLITGLSQAGRPDPVILDFTHPERTTWVLSQAETSPCSLVIGTSGLEDQTVGQIEALAERRAILLIDNASTGIRVLSQALRHLAEIGGGRWDASILDIHFKGKADAISGTAKALARQWADAHAPEAQSADIAAFRQGNGVSEHRVLCHAPGEVIELVHRIEDRSALLHPVLTAAKKLGQATPRLYSMEDFL